MSPSLVRAPSTICRPAVRRLPALVVLVLALTFGSGAVVHGAQRGDDTGSPTGSLRPLALVRSAASRVLAIAQSPPAGITGSEDRRTGIRRVAHDLFAFNEMARRVMGQHATDCLPQEQDEFVRLFADVFTQAYVTTVERYSGENVAFLGEEVTGAFAQVRSLVITTRGSRMSIEYQLLARGPRWAVYDIVLDGASLVSTYRSLFNSSIRTSSFAQLMERMRTEQLRRQARDAGTSFRATEREPSRGRLEGLLLVAPSSARGR
jgi:phospholipid transport system substrate-binding protein